MTDYVKHLDNTTDVSYKSDNACSIIFVIPVGTDFKGPEEGRYTGIPPMGPGHGKLLFLILK